MRNSSLLATTLFFGALLAPPPADATVGKVADTLRQPVAGARVSYLSDTNQFTTTNAAGEFLLSRATGTRGRPAKSSGLSAIRTGQGLRISTDRDLVGTIQAIDLEGRTVLRAPVRLGPGQESTLAFPHPLSVGLLRFESEDGANLTALLAPAGRSDLSANPSAARAADAPPDTLLISHPGYLSTVFVANPGSIATLFPWLTDKGQRRLPAGSFQMGTSVDAFTNSTLLPNGPAHTVELHGFWIDTAEVTQGEFRSLMGYNPSGYGSRTVQVEPYDTLSLPVEQVTWFDALLFCNARSVRDGLDTVYTWRRAHFTTGPDGRHCDSLVGLYRDTVNGYQLPTEAQWEYAVRAGTTTRFPWGDDSSKSVLYAWTAGNPALPGQIPSTHPAGELLPNFWGLYDMIGNVAEWVWDSPAPYVYPARKEYEPQGNWAAGAEGLRVVRGGYLGQSVSGLDSPCTSAGRGANPAATDMPYSSGFRVVRRAR